MSTTTPPEHRDTDRKLEEYLEQEEGATHRLSGWSREIVGLLAVLMSLFHLYAAWTIVPTQLQRLVHVAFALMLVFLMYPLRRRDRDRLRLWDPLFAAVPLIVAWYAWSGGDDFTDRNTLPNDLDIVMGVMLIAMILEALRRTSGWIMVAVTSLFLAYALAGPLLPPPWTHKGYEVGRLVGHMVMTLEGIFGVAVDVSSSLIILFSIFGAFLQHSGAGRFFIDFSFSMMGGKPTGVGRTVVLSSFLLGGPSGSGVATTVTIGSVAWPMLSRAGYERNAAGGLLAAAGLGAIISPPVLGAAAFLIAEFLRLSYLDVLLMAAIPTLLFYACLFVMVEIDARKYGMRAGDLPAVENVRALTLRYGFHFLSLISIIVFMLMGFSPVMSVFWATLVSFFTSLLRADTSLLPRERNAQGWGRTLSDSGLVRALRDGATGTLGVAVTCAGAGLIVGVVTLTGLGLKFSSIVIDYAGGSLLLTAVYTALIVWIVGLAVPVTASYIICAVVAAPALIKLGVPDYAAHMFIFYYAVLSEVSPPTALSPFAAAAITGGNPYRTTLQSWKYTLPAFLVPFMFVLDPSGLGLLLHGSLKALPTLDWWAVVWVTITAFVGVISLAAASQGWLLLRTNPAERLLLIVAGLALVATTRLGDGLGLACVAVVLGLQWARGRRALAGR